MEQLSEILISYGPWGMFLSAFLAGSILPFSSEAIMVALLALGGSPWLLLLTASAGNTLGGVSCYCVGRIASPEWLQRTFRIKDKHMQRARALVSRWGAWMGFLCWVPVLGDAILVTLGIMRSHPLATNVTMLIGRTLRYAVVLLSALGVEKLF
jgi:membrane protein YqaA with SNARE-associated domain